MPLKSGSSQKAISQNVKTEMERFKKTGKIGTSKPESKAAAQKQAVAIALSKAGKNQVSEQHNIISFLKAVSQKNYSEANKYLQEVVNSKLKARIEAASKNKIF
jgi:hypothetical protein